MGEPAGFAFFTRSGVKPFQEWILVRRGIFVLRARNILNKFKRAVEQGDSNMTTRLLISGLRKCLILACFCIGTANATAVDCTGIPTQVRNWGSSGYVAVSLSGYTGTWIICSYDQTVGNVTPAACKGMVATLLTGLAAQRPVDLEFNTYSDCASVPSFNTALPASLNYVVGE
jgi:hypothetical protein